MCTNASKINTVSYFIHAYWVTYTMALLSYRWTRGLLWLLEPRKILVRREVNRRETRVRLEKKNKEKVKLGFGADLIHNLHM